MRCLGGRIRWIYQTTTRTIIICVSAFLATMVAHVRSMHDNFLDDNVPVPEFLPGAANITVREGDYALLPCSVRHLGTKQVAWRRIAEDKFLTIGTMTWAGDNNVSMDHSKKPDHVTNWNLIIQHVKPEDAGVYECQVTSRAGHVRLVKLIVVGPPITKPDSTQLSRQPHPGLGTSIPNVQVSVCGAADLNGCLISITGKKYVDLGEKIHLICNASGGPRIPDEIDWFKAGDKIDSAKYRHVMLDKYQSMADRSFISELIIEHSSLSDTGDYICRSSRNDIANLKVTVLHAESANKRRGTGPGPSAGKAQADDSAGQGHHNCGVSILTLTAWAVILTLYSASLCTYS